ncbi:hypothetical protein [Mesorhizobium sp. NZP2298]|uniref:hypothetical protein n=1 Tax=Mesorhizobium sp. NZP2298 TaxID=2483403 RepID=UPI0015517569|nr:hypothetical protein [Mesorhizobium sp. NZP2298]QKC96079.1 hypothetical protein EB231_16290 [Mesorhizobium sp. NZP2298]
MLEAQTAIIATLVAELEKTGALPKRDFMYRVAGLIGGYADTKELPEKSNPIKRLRSILEMAAQPFIGVR